ncbi:hypothetical protein LEP1GSC133_4970 [Leptospira borgpetersenii serovar Pomona str. 200901868]|uniref:Uncharacterized protein n=1 Tax=Leptospira borgpetersenii serovar Pomona str. 200901868 TaxID=1192866 RepID=M6VZI7_LEPBO|nr:hypothetical protein LEP1GSC133_4970 [Leptospira borgpetersenii serovar Pomona str. 200901868]
MPELIRFGNNFLNFILSWILKDFFRVCSVYIFVSRFDRTVRDIGIVLRVRKIFRYLHLVSSYLRYEGRGL